ncbi:MAG: hypothetical protein OEU94_13365, partial [Aquincola sp.]|nr:hypothetical protein [Aquincola sp.]
MKAERLPQREAAPPVTRRAAAEANPPPLGAASPGAAVHSIGQRQPLVDGVEKVSGAAHYTADLPVPNPLVGRIGRSAVAHGVIRRIDA